MSKRAILYRSERTIINDLLTIKKMEKLYRDNEEAWKGLITDMRDYYITTETDAGKTVEPVHPRRILYTVALICVDKYNHEILKVLDEQVIIGTGLAPKNVEYFDELRIPIPGGSQGNMGRFEKLFFLLLGLVAEDKKIL